MTVHHQGTAAASPLSHTDYIWASGKTLPASPEEREKLPHGLDIRFPHIHGKAALLQHGTQILLCPLFLSGNSGKTDELFGIRNEFRCQRFDHSIDLLCKSCIHKKPPVALVSYLSAIIARLTNISEHPYGEIPAALFRPFALPAPVSLLPPCSAVPSGQ